MKKLTVIFCVICLLSNITIYADETSTTYSMEQKIEKLKQYNIINCYEDGSFQPQNNVTRAEFCKMVSVMLGIDDKEKSIDNNNFFADVPTEHWANQYITFCYSRGLINGVMEAEKLYFVDLDENGNEIDQSELFYRDDFNELYGTNATIPENLFAPDDYITYQDALKILVCALGYEEVAKQRGDYPVGYVSVATEIGIISDKCVTTDYISRGNTAEIIYDSLFVPLLISESISDENGDRTEYIIADGTNGVQLQTLYKNYFEKYESSGDNGFSAHK